MLIFALFVFGIYKLGFGKLELMKSIMGQLFAVVGPVFLVLTIVKAYKMHQFLKRNKENIELGQEIKYSQSKDSIEKVTIFFLLILIGFVLGEIIYRWIVLKDTSVFSFLIPYIIANLIVLFYRRVIKPSKKSYDFKVISSYLAVIIAIVVAVILSYKIMGDLEGMDFSDPEVIQIVRERLEL
nr:hypothetical protein [Tissierella sp.]